VDLLDWPLSANSVPQTEQARLPWIVATVSSSPLGSYSIWLQWLVEKSLVVTRPTMAHRLVGEEKGVGREPKPDFKKISLKLYHETIDLIQQLPLGQQYEIDKQDLTGGS
jgi:hypothetical protein